MISILIPTRNRSYFMIRLLSYYRDLQFAGQIYISDLSDNEHAERLRSAVELLGEEININYRKLPTTGMVTAVTEMLQLVSTSYTVIQQDTNFLVPNSLQQCERFLDENADYSGVSGLSINMEMHSFGAFGALRKIELLEGQSITDDDGSVRVVEFLKDYNPLISPVLRTDILRRIFHCGSDMSDDFLGMFLMPGCMGSAVGKMKILSGLHLARQISESTEIEADWLSWITTPEWRPSFLFFRDMLSAEVSSRSTICLEEAEILIEQGISLIIDKHQSNIENSANQKIGGFRRFARGVFEFMPSLGSLYRNLMPFTQPKRFERSLDGWVQVEHRHYNDFIPIHRAMTLPRVSLLLGNDLNHLQF